MDIRNITCSARNEIGYTEATQSISGNFYYFSVHQIIVFCSLYDNVGVFLILFNIVNFMISFLSLGDIPARFRRYPY